LRNSYLAIIPQKKLNCLITPAAEGGAVVMTLTKAGIAEAIYKKTRRYTRIQSLELVDSLFEIMKQTLESGEDVLISSFGKFSVKEKRERIGRNPQNGQPMMLTARKVVNFKWSGRLRNKINTKR
jgi:integration host factor subunit alpha